MLVNEAVLPEILTNELLSLKRLPLPALLIIAEAGTANARINAEIVSDFLSGLISVFRFQI